MTKDEILNIIYKNSSADENGLHISFKQMEAIVELLLIQKTRTRVEMAHDYMSRKGITFGSSYGDEMGIDLFIAGMEAQEKISK